MTRLSPAGIAVLLGQDQPAGILAAAALRERRAKAATPGPWRPNRHGTLIGVEAGDHLVCEVEPCAVHEERPHEDTEHIAAEANPVHALAEVALWRTIVREHNHPSYVCADFDAVRTAARAYLGGAA